MSPRPSRAIARIRSVNTGLSPAARRPSIQRSSAALSAASSASFASSPRRTAI
jgi:hypothetical protein